MASMTPAAETSRVKTPPSAIGLASLGRAIRRYSLLVFIFAIFAAIAGALVYFFLPLPKYTGRVVYLVSSNQEKILHDVWSERDNQNFRLMQHETLMRRTLLNQAMSEPGVATLPVFEKDRSLDGVQYLQSNLRVQWRTNEHMMVSLEGHEPDEIKMILKAVDKAYKNQVIFNEMNRRQERMSQLRNLQASYIEKTRTIRANIRNIMSKVSASADPILQQQQERVLQAMMSQSDQELQRLYTRTRELQAEEKRRTEEMKVPVAMRSPVPPEVINNMVEGLPQVRELRARIDQIENQLPGWKDKLKPGAPLPPQYETLLAEKTALESRLNEGLPKARADMDKLVRTERAKDEQLYLARIRAELDFIKQQIDVVNKDCAENAKRMQVFRDQYASVEDLNSEVRNNETISAQLTNDLVKMQAEMDAPLRVKVWEEVDVYPGIEGNRRVKYTAVAVAAFLILGMALAQYLEIRHRRIQHLTEVTDGLGLPVIGTVPAIPKGGAAARSNWPHLLTEAVNTTRTMLLSGPNSEHTRTLLVTSAMSGEGKTSLTTHLAVSLASAGRRVLLIDADMRRPAVHKVLGLTSKPGLAELLVGNAKLDEVTQTCKVAGLHLVPAGVYSREAAASLNTEAFQRIVQEASVGYDFVLIDSPPILPVADALAISKNVDGVLISVMQDLSRYGAVQTACQRLSMVGANVLGVVVSGVKSANGYYYYYYDERYTKPPQGATPPAASAPAPATSTAIVPTTPPEVI